MPVNFSIKNVPDELAEALRQRARQNHRSLQGELMAILTRAATPPAPAVVRETPEAWGSEPDLKSNEFGRPLPAPALAIPEDDIARFCRRWKVKELALFGSVLRADFRPDSDVDVLARFEPDAPWSLFDIGDMEAELTKMFGRKVDLVEREAVEQSRNWIRRRHILENHRVIYAA